MSTTQTKPFTVEYQKGSHQYSVTATPRGLDVIERVLAGGLAAAADDLASALAEEETEDSIGRVNAARARVRGLGGGWVNGAASGTRLERLRAHARSNGVAPLDQLFVGGVLAAASAARHEFGEIKELARDIRDGLIESVGEKRAARGW